MLSLIALLAAVALAVCADQAAKALSRRWLADGRRHPPGLRWVLNARGSLVGLPVAWAIGLWIALAAGALVVAQSSPSLDGYGAVGLGLAVGGATSNLADRVLRGGVVDVIAVGVWPTFNLADAAMVTGMVLLAGSLA
jgi:signal peptidase II